MAITISGADVFTPGAAKLELQKVATVYADLTASIEQSRNNLARQGVSDAPIEMLAEMFEEASILAAAAQQSAERFAWHGGVVADTIGSDPSLAGTQQGRYMDPAAL